MDYTLYALRIFAVAKGVEFVEPPERQPWGGVLAHFKDPEQNIMTLVGAVDE
ncbi:MAG: hypothetical protein OES38_17160 [Gammaproteobacteria bacterium]|nr:hypothetical protein [Gammaproteobacteria bacterium]